MTATPLDTLLDSLLREFHGDPRGRRAAELLAEYGTRHDDWQRFAHFQPECYTRNLVGRNEHFEMLILCWSAGAESPIHDHSGQNCWMTILEGSIEEVQYPFPRSAGSGPLLPASSKRFERGRVAFIQDEIALHRVRPVEARRAVSLHLYSRPIDVCRVFDEATGTIVEKTLLYHSVGGARSPS